MWQLPDLRASDVRESESTPKMEVEAISYPNLEGDLLLLPPQSIC